MAINKIISDDELIIRIRQGNEVATNEMFSRYDLYSWRIAHDFNTSYPNSGIDINEYHQVAFSSLLAAIKFYSLEYGAFYLYWKKLAWNELLDYFGKNSYITNPSPLPKNGSYGYLSEEDFGKPDYSLTDKLEMQDIEDIISETITKFKSEKDREIINLFLQDMNFEKIHEISNIPIRKIYYVISRFKRYFLDKYERW